MQAVSALASTLLMILVALGAAVAAYTIISGAAAEKPELETRIFTVKATGFEVFSGQYGGVKYTLPYILGLRVYIHGDFIQRFTAYMVSGSQAVRLRPHPVHGIEAGEPTILYLLAEEPLWEGAYTLIVSTGYGEARTRIQLVNPMGESVNFTLCGPAAMQAQASTAYVDYIVECTTTLDGNYNVTFYICAKPGVTVLAAYAAIYNSTGQPPKWVNGWTPWVYPKPYTWPDCAIAYFVPIDPAETPVTLVLASMPKRS